MEKWYLPGVKLEYLRYVAYSDKFLEERFWREYILVGKKFPTEHL